MRVLRSLVNFQFAKQLSSQCIMRKHSFNSFLNNPFRYSLLKSIKSFNFHTTRSSRMPPVKFLSTFSAGNLNFLSINNNNEIPSI